VIPSTIKIAHLPATHRCCPIWNHSNHLAFIVLSGATGRYVPFSSISVARKWPTARDSLTIPGKRDQRQRLMLLACLLNTNLQLASAQRLTDRDDSRDVKSICVPIVSQ
jgi:hypothetical protein